MNEECFFTIKRQNGDRMLIEEILLSPVHAQKIKDWLNEQQRPYNAAEARPNTPYSQDGKHIRRGPASEGQRRFIASLEQNSTQRNKIQQYIRENHINMDTLTNAQANEIIQAGKY